MTESNPLRTYSGLETIVPRQSAASLIAKLETGGLFADRYQIERMLGEGGMSVVYLAKDRNIDQDIVLKLLASRLVSQEAMERLKSEGFMARKIRHPNIVAVYDIGQISGQPYLTMEYVPGASLRKWIGDAIRGGREISLETALAIVRPILSGLAEAHRMGVVHRDLKPENIMLCGEPGRSDFRLKILDFGIARAVDSRTDSADTSGGMLGTALYMAPEQRTAPDTVGPPADLYSVSAIFFELLMEAPPQGWEAPSEHRPDIPKEIDAVLERGLKIRARSRFQNADEYLRALDAASHAGTPAQTRTQPAPAPIQGFYAPGLSNAIEAAEVAAKQAREIALRAQLRQKEAQSAAARAQDAASRASAQATRARETAARAQDAAKLARETAQRAEATFAGGRVGIWNGFHVWNGTNTQNTNLRWAAQIDGSKTTQYRTVPVRGLCTFADGHAYAGETRDWVRQGLGVFTFANGDYYAGEWSNELYHGLGVLVVSKGWSYAGEFRDGKQAGGLSTHTDGGTYAGEMRADNAEGLGVRTWPDDPVQRKWNDLAQLKTQVSGNSYAGEWRDNLNNGVGVDTRSDGWSYAGELRDGKRIGAGVSAFANGQCYAGEWKDNDCRIYVRTFSPGQVEREYSGQHDGYGVLLLIDGRSQKGEWKNGQLNGYGAKFDAQGRMTEQGQYEAGQLKLRLPS